MFIKKSKRPTLNIRNRQDDEEGDERPTKRIVKKSIVFSSLDDEEEGEIFKVKKSKVSKLMSRGVNVSVPTTSFPPLPSSIPPTKSSSHYSQEAIAKMKAQYTSYKAPPPNKDEMELEEISERYPKYNDDKMDIDIQVKEEIEEDDDEEGNTISSLAIERAKQKRQKMRDVHNENFLSLDSAEIEVVTEQEKQSILQEAAVKFVNKKSVNEDDTGVDEEMLQWEMNAIKRGGQTKDFNRVKKADKKNSRIYSSTTMAYGSEEKKTISFSQRISVNQIKSSLQKSLDEIDVKVKEEQRRCIQFQVEIESSASIVNSKKQNLSAASARYEYFCKLRDYLVDISGCLSFKRQSIEELLDEVMHARGAALISDFKPMYLQMDHIRNEARKTGVLINEGGPLCFNLLTVAIGPDEDVTYLGGKYNSERIIHLKHWDFQSFPFLSIVNYVSKCSLFEDLSISSISQLGIQLNTFLNTKNSIFEDVLPEIISMETLRYEFEEWAKLYPKDYKIAYASIGLPDIVQVMATYDMILWDPVQQIPSDSSLDNFQWYESFFTFDDIEGTSEDDPSLVSQKDLIPEIAQRIGLSLLEKHVKFSWSLYSTNQCTALNNAISEILIYEPSPMSITSIQNAIYSKITDIIADYSVPLFSLSSGREDFFDFTLNQIALGIKLGKNVIILKDYLASKNAEEIVCQKIIMGRIFPFLDILKRHLASLVEPHFDLVASPLCLLFFEICETILTNFLPVQWRQSSYLQIFREDIMISISRMLPSMSNNSSSLKTAVNKFCNFLNLCGLSQEALKLKSSI